MIDRYRHVVRSGRMEIHPTAPYVKYEDHRSVVDELLEAIESAKNALEDESQRSAFVRNDLDVLVAYLNDMLNKYEEKILATIAKAKGEEK